jgi:hypothetical protein
MRNWMNKINLIVIGVSLVFLSGCANLGRVPISNCPTAPHYSAQEWQKIEESVAALPEQSPLIPVLQDYMDLLDKLKIANQGE